MCICVCLCACVHVFVCMLFLLSARRHCVVICLNSWGHPQSLNNHDDDDDTSNNNYWRAPVMAPLPHLLTVLPTCRSSPPPSFPAPPTHPLPRPLKPPPLSCLLCAPAICLSHPLIHCPTHSNYPPPLSCLGLTASLSASHLASLPDSAG